MSGKLHTLKEAAQNSRMSESWWRLKICKKEIRYLKIGNRIFIEDAVINQLFTDSVIEPQQTEATHD